MSEATKKRGGLGRNLSALLGPHYQTDNQAPAQMVMELLPLTRLVPGRYQPRRTFDEASLTELAQSIQQQGLLQPLVVRETSSGAYELIAGERRWRACQMAGMTLVPVVIRQVDDETATALALIENIQRDDLSPLDQARGMQRLVTDFSLTHQEISTLLSKSRASVSNYLRLLHLAEDVRAMLDRGDLDMGHARCLLTLTLMEQSQVAEQIVQRGMSVRETEQWVARLKEPTSKVVETRVNEWAWAQGKLDALSTQLDTKVMLKPGTSGRGSLVIHYSDGARLDSIMDTLLD